MAARNGSEEGIEIDVIVLGAGFVGVTTAVSLAEKGHRVHLVEKSRARLAALSDHRIPFHEPGLEDAWRAVCDQGLASVTDALPDVRARVVMLCVGTPPLPDGSADTSQLAAAAEDVAGWVAADPARAPVVVTKSTVPPGSSRGIVLPRFAGLPRERFGIASNPEFLKEGAALADARAPDRIVVGPMDAMAAAVLRELYAGFTAPYVETADPETAETIKYVANAYLATKIAFSNEVANLCERLGIHVDDVMQGVGLDPRIGGLFLRSGLGFGGSCFPKDVSALQSIAQARGVELTILEAVLANNETQPLRAIALAEELVGSLRGKRVALMGLSFKAHTSDVRETRALPIYRALVAAGAHVVACDPIATDEFKSLVGGAVELVRDPREALTGADVAIFQTEWPQFKALAPEDFRRMRRAAVVDGRRILDARALRAAGIEYRGIGVGSGAKR